MTPIQEPTPKEFADASHQAGCPVQHTNEGIVVVGHEEVRAVVQDPATFSSAVSAHLQLPNGLDGAEHEAWRGLVDSYLGEPEVRAAESGFKAVAHSIVDGLHAGEHEMVMEVGAEYAVRGMLAWLGWPESLSEALVQWVVDNHEATRSREPGRNADVARRFDAIVRSVVEPRLACPSNFDDVTAALVCDRSLGRQLSIEELVSILRNWTAGDLGSMAACIGVIAQGLAEHPVLQERIRGGATDSECEAILNELLRIDDPFVSNRRVATHAATLAGVAIEEGEVLRVHWTGANRDPRVFGDPEVPSPVVNAGANLVWGTGPHACPGRGLSLMELRVFFRALLGRFVINDATRGTRAAYPVGGWETLWVTLRELPDKTPSNR